MGFRCGIVGLPNVGKSTLFNALVNAAAAAAENYPFCTIEPNVGRVPVPDRRLEAVARVSKSARVVATQIEFVDIAGLVRGASRGEGLGNRFLGHIREVDAIVHVLRCFEDPDVSHVEGAVDPLRDADIVGTELMLADLESLERRAEPLTKKARGGDKAAKADLALVERLIEALGEGRAARSVAAGPGRLRRLQLLTARPVLYVCNVAEEDAAAGNAWTEKVARRAASEQASMVIVSAAIEAEVAALDDDDARREFLAAMGLDESGLDRVIGAGYALLDLVTFFTGGPKEAHAWTVKRGARAPQAAGVIHSDFERGFIRVETIAVDDLIALGGEQGAKEAGKMRVEGRDYVVRDGDVLYFRFNV